MIYASLIADWPPARTLWQFRPFKARLLLGRHNQNARWASSRSGGSPAPREGHRFISPLDGVQPTCKFATVSGQVWSIARNRGATVGEPSHRARRVGRAKTKSASRPAHASPHRTCHRAALSQRPTVPSAKEQTRQISSVARSPLPKDRGGDRDTVPCPAKRTSPSSRRQRAARRSSWRFAGPSTRHRRPGSAPQ